MIVFDDSPWELQRMKPERPKVAIDAFIESFALQLRVRERKHQAVVEKLVKRSDKDLVGAPVVHTEKWESECEKKKD